MIPALLDSSSALLSALLRASLEGAVLALLVAALCRLAPGLPARLRCWLWWLVGLKLLVGLAGIAPVRLAVLPAPERGAVSELRQAAEAAPRGLRVPPEAKPGEIGEVAPGPRPEAARNRLRQVWPTLLSGLWLAGAVAGLLALAGSFARTRRLRRDALPLPPAQGGLGWESLAHRLGLAQAPEIRVSSRISIPQVVGPFRPMILLPLESCSRLGGDEFSLLIAHELCHLARRDLFWGWVPALAERLFFFHPAAVLAGREYALAREAACDAQVLRLLGAAPREYGRMLLRWGLAPRETGLAAAVASPSAKNLKRRLEMLQDATSSRLRAGRWWAAAALAVAALVPLQLVARTAPAPAARASAAASATVATSATTAAAPAASAPSRAAEAGHAKPATSSYSYSYSSSDEDDSELDAWGWFEGDDSVTTTFNGRGLDSEKLDSLRARYGSPLLWLRKDGKNYVIHDAALLSEARALLQPMQDLGKQQGELGNQQGKLGEKQGALGGKQGELGAKQGALGAQQGELGAKIAALAAKQAALAVRSKDRDADDDEKADHAVEAKMEAVGREMDQLDEQQEELGRQQEELGRQQEELGKQQEELGRQQEELGRQQEAASHRAGEGLARLLERALHEGKAEAVR